MGERVYPAPPEYEEFKSGIRKLTGIDLDIYKYQIHRRVHMLMGQWRLSDYGDYLRIIQSDPQKKREFLDYITINVSEFFRNPARWWALRDEVIPGFLERKGRANLRLWSAGCATGEEPYSLAILALEMGLSGASVIAMEIDRGALEKARKAVYMERQLVSVPSEWQQKYFRPVGNGLFEVEPRIRQRVDFRQGNLLEDAFPEQVDLILCRNVVIYFSSETKERLYRKFFQSLVPGGVLMVGATEQIFGYREIGFESVGPFLYRRPLEACVIGGCAR